MFHLNAIIVPAFCSHFYLARGNPHSLLTSIMLVEMTTNTPSKMEKIKKDEPVRKRKLNDATIPEKQKKKKKQGVRAVEH